MKKKCVVLYFENIPIAVYEIKEVEPLEFIKIKKECERNFEIIQNDFKESKKELENQIQRLAEDIKYLKGEC